MHKLLIPLLLLSFICFAEDKTPQPTFEERLSIMQHQRDWLIADRQAHDKADIVDAEAKELAAKYHCKSWNPDFTCVVLTKDEQKAAEKAAKPEK